MALPTNPLPGAVSEAGVIIQAISGLHGHQLVDLGPEGLKAALIPKDMTLNSLKPLVDAWRLHPERVSQTVASGTVESLIAYLNRFKTANSLGFYDANDVRAMLVALDYHEPAATPDPKASHVTHLAAYRFPLSDELLAWLKFASQLQESTDFAEFLLDRAHDVESPPVDWMLVEPETLKAVTDALNLHDDRVPSSIGRDARGDYVGVEELAAEFAIREDDEEGVEPDDGGHVPRTAIYKLRKMRFAGANTIVSLARSVQVNQASKARSSYDPKSGNMVVQFEEENTAVNRAGTRVKIPDGFFLFIPVFRGEPPRLIPCRLKHRVRGTVMWQVEIADAQRMIDRAITAAAQRVEAATGIPMLRGLPVGTNAVNALTAEPAQVRDINKALGRG